MTSLANILITAPQQASPAGDVLWRNADLEQLEFVGAVPSDSLLAELLTFKSGGEAGTTISRLVPGRRHLATLVAHPAKSVRLGATRNRQITRTELDVLTQDTDAEVAAAAGETLALRADLLTRARGGDIDALGTLLGEPHVEALGELLDTDPGLVIVGCAAVDTARLFGRLEVLDPDLRDRIGLAVVTEGSARISATVARWVTGTSEPAQAGAAALVAQKTTLRRRLTPGAERVLVDAGLLAATTAPQTPVRHASLEAMALILDTAEIAAMYFSSSSEVSGELLARIAQEAPVSLLVNHLIGQTPRRPSPGSVRTMLSGVSAERRLSIAEALEACDASQVLDRVAWAGELLLGFKRAGAAQLDVDSVAELLTAIDEHLAGNELAWEYLMALSEEWEATIFDLLTSAAAMEGINRTAVPEPVGEPA